MRKSIKITVNALGLAFYIMAAQCEQLGLPVAPLILYVLSASLMSFKLLFVVNLVTNIQYYFLNPLAYIFFRFYIHVVLMGGW